jgi:hypothetical protein
VVWSKIQEVLSPSFKSVHTILNILSQLHIWFFCCSKAQKVSLYVFTHSKAPVCHSYLIYSQCKLYTTSWLLFGSNQGSGSVQYFLNIVEGAQFIGVWWAANSSVPQNDSAYRLSICPSTCHLFGKNKKKACLKQALSSFNNFSRQVDQEAAACTSR